MTKASVKVFSTSAIAERYSTALELVCLVDSVAALRAAVDNGADCVRLEYRDTPPAHCIAGMAVDNGSLAKGIQYAHDRRCKALLELDADSDPVNWERLRDIIHCAAQSGVDALILSDPALMLYAATRYPDLRLHYAASEAAANSGAINFLQKQFGVSRVVLPRIMSLAQVRQLSKNTTVELEVFGFGRLCTIVEGRDTASFGLPVGTEDRNASTSDGLESCCGGNEDASNDSCYAIQHRPDINTLGLLPQLTATGVRAIKVEAPDYEPALLARLTRVWREAIDDCLENFDRYTVKPSWIAELNRLAMERWQTPPNLAASGKP